VGYLDIESGETWVEGSIVHSWTVSLLSVFSFLSCTLYATRKPPTLLFYIKNIIKFYITILLLILSDLKTDSDLC
jgi:hypothetical protein